jgi:phosphoglycerate kinase
VAKLTIRDLNLAGTRLFVRVDFNVPIQDGVITDDTRIRETLPTIRYALDHGATVILASHFGRPKGKVKPELSLKPVAARLSELLGRRVIFAEDSVGDPAQTAVAQAVKEGGTALGPVVLLENLRFHAEEEKNDPAFAAELAKLADLYVNDAFGSSHRAHASVEALARLLPTPAAGLLMEKEVKYLSQALGTPAHPFIAVLGGVKVSDKIELIENMLTRVDALVIGGAMANTFLKAHGVPIGNSIVEDDKLDAARQIEQHAAERKVTLKLPVDTVVAEKVAAGAACKTLKIGDPAIGNWERVDIGPATIEAYCDIIRTARTLVWNGPMGVFEFPPFDAGTNAIARAVAAVDGVTIVGGGDSVAAITKAGVADKITHISTGGGASLEFLGGRKLPGVEALEDKK